MVKHNFYIAFLCSLLIGVSACGRKCVYSQYENIDNDGWKKDSVAVFDVEVSDTIGTYDVIINIRNRNEYPYQNLYLFIASTSPKNVVVRDTLNCILADNKGNWYGSGIGSTSNLPILYMSKIKFPQKGVYHFEIKQGMRETILQGINDIGLKVKVSDNEQK